MQTRRWLSPVLIGTSLVCAYALGAHGAGVPATGALAYSGTLAMGGAPINAATYSIAVSLWDVETGGVVGTNRKCDTGTLTTSVSQGHFHVVLPEECALAVAAQPDLWVEVTAAGSVLSPRVKVRSVPFAMEATHASKADTAASVLGASVRYSTACTAVAPGSPNVDCTCEANEVAIGGGANGPNALLDESRPVDSRTWRLGCAQFANGQSVRLPCIATSVVCLRISP